jgi:hypothetical protein
MNTDALVRQRIDKILTFFLNLAHSNALSTTPAVERLEKALSFLRRGDDFSRTVKTEWRERLAQLAAPSKVQADRLTQLRNICLDGFPIFNIWDSISFIYTLCAEDVKTQLGAELHLYQFRMIVKSLCECRTYFDNVARTNTVAASWAVESRSQPLNIAFATTCIGLADAEKAAMAEARREFMKILTDTLKKDSQTVNTRLVSPNAPGNCPEYLVWPSACGKVGRYQSLCFNIKDESAYRCCTRCETTLAKLGANGIEVDDLWATALLSTGTISTKEPYPSRKLKPKEDVLKEYGKLTKL